MVIVREKDLPEEEYEILAGQVMAVCREQQLGCVLHSYPGAARRLGCPAIHMPFAYFREQWESLLDFRVRGTSVHSAEDALWAQEHGATYVTASGGWLPGGRSFWKGSAGSSPFPYTPSEASALSAWMR